MEAYTLNEVNEYIRQVIALNFQESIWIECEISQLKEVRGQVYLDLIEKAEDSKEIIAQSQAVIWYKEYLFIKKKLGDLLPSILSPGVRVKIKALIEFHEKYGLKLVIQDVDPSYTMGLFELAKQKILERLRSEDLIDLNSSKSLPTVIQKIAIISSEKAAGYQDFVSQISSNAYGYDFELKLYSAAMQGQNTEREVVSQLREISKEAEYYDLILIIRGGGSKADLSSFDNYNIAATIASLEIPVLTGIGHDIDETVADIVAHTSLKTPTAAADFIIDHNSNFESELQYYELAILNSSQQKISNIKEELNYLQNQIFQYPSEILANTRELVVQVDSEFKKLVEILIGNIKIELKSYSDLVSALTPENILQRGFTIIKQDNKVIVSEKKLREENEFEIIFKDGTKRGSFKD